MSTLRFTQDHEWINTAADGTATIGITDHAQEALGDIVFVELPKIGAAFKQGDAACVVESVKAAADVKMPVAGIITAVNDSLTDNPALVNTDPVGAAWFIKIKPNNPTDIDALMDEATYQTLIGN